MGGVVETFQVVALDEDGPKLAADFTLPKSGEVGVTAEDCTLLLV